MPTVEFAQHRPPPVQHAAQPSGSGAAGSSTACDAAVVGVARSVRKTRRVGGMLNETLKASVEALAYASASPAPQSGACDPAKPKRAA